MRVALSKSVSLATETLPSSGAMRPATQSSRVDLPAPDGPKRMVKPAGITMSAERCNEPREKLTRIANPDWASSTAIAHLRAG